MAYLLIFFMQSMRADSVQPVGWNAKLVNWFLHNAQLAALLFICVVLGGVFALFSLQSEGFPSPAINQIIVTTVYKGASPEEVERSIIKPIEAAVGAVKGVSETQSVAANSFATVGISFDAGADFTAGLSDVRSKIQNLDLPKDTDKPDLLVPSFGGNNSIYAIVGNGEPATLRAAGEKLRLDLEAVSGVKDFKLLSPVQDVINVNWRLADMARLGVTPQDITTALQANNVTIPAGSFVTGGANASAVTNGSLKSPDELKKVVVKFSAAKTVTVTDVADVASAYQYQNLSRQIGYKAKTDKDGAVRLQNGLLYQLSYKDGANVLSVAPEVQKVLDANQVDLKAAGKDLVTLSDVAVSIRQQIDDIKGGAIGSKIGEGPFANLGYILGGIWLIMLAMLIFVSWRAALISAVAIPVSLLFTLLALQVQGVSLNTLTLFSMVLVLGLIVDPAIVVLEAIQRELDLGRRGLAAVIAAMNTVGSGVFYAVLTSMIVFVPFGVVSGVFGQIIKYIPITIIPALLASYLVPVLFLTFLAQRFLKPSKDAKDDEEIGNLWAVSQWFVRTNTKILTTKWLQVVIIALAVIVPLGVSGALFATGKISPVQFSAPTDSEQMSAQVEYPANFTKERKEQLVQQLESTVAGEKWVESYFAFQETDQSVVLQATLLPRKLRDSDSPALVKDLQEKLTALSRPDTHIFFSAATQSVGTPESAFPVAVNIYGDDLAVLKRAAIQTGDILRTQAKVTRVEDGFTGENTPQLEITIDRDKLAATGMPAVQVAGALNAVMGSSTVTKFEQQIDGASRTVEVILGNASTPASVQDVKDTVLMVGPKGPITVADVASVNLTNGFTGIKRLNGSRYVTVQAQVADKLKDATPVQNAVKNFWTKDKLAEFGLRPDALDNKGNNDEFIKSFKDLFIALGVAILMLYISLVVFLKSFSQPFIILFAVPLTFVGVFPALTLVGGQFGFLEILGIITLSGIVVNVGIFLLDLANQRRAMGIPLRQAIAEATGIRFRPIFLTKATTLGGLLPLILLSAFWRSLATVVVAGVLVSGFLSLFTTPILYVWFVEFKERVSRGIRRTKKS